MKPIKIIYYSNKYEGIILGNQFNDLVDILEEVDGHVEMFYTIRCKDLRSIRSNRDFQGDKEKYTLKFIHA